MQLGEMVKMVLVNILANKSRSFLTALGIIVGAATIILVVAVGKAGEAAVAEQFKRLNATTIYVMSSWGQGYRKSLDETDLENITNRCASVEMATLINSGQAETVFGGLSFDGSVYGVFPEAEPLNNLEIEAGRFVTDNDNENRNRVVVLGAETAQELFGEDPQAALQKTVEISGQKFKVVGVLKTMGDSMGRMNMDECSIVPYVMAEGYILGRNTYPQIVAQAVDFETVSTAIDEITNALRRTHTIYKVRGEDDFMVRDAGSMLVAAQDSAKTLSVLLTVVAAIVLVVGGIGIMNVMFVSVKERTREIGILKAIGARKQDILLQFLLEAVVISFTGGALGAGLGTLMVPLMQYFELTAVPSASGVILALGFSIFTGTFFGYYPALQAAKLNPLTALSYE